MTFFLCGLISPKRTRHSSSLDGNGRGRLACLDEGEHGSHAVCSSEGETWVRPCTPHFTVLDVVPAILSRRGGGEEGRGERGDGNLVLSAIAVTKPETSSSRRPFLIGKLAILGKSKSPFLVLVLVQRARICFSMSTEKDDARTR